MSPSWSLLDLTTFDLLMRRGVDTPAKVDAAPSDPDHLVLRKWVQSARAADPEADRLSGLAVRSLHWIRLALWLFSLLAGWAAATALLHYQGERLINISAYIGVLVGGQLAALLALGAIQLLHRHSLPALHRWFLPSALKEIRVLYALPAWRWRLFTLFQFGGVWFNIGVLAGTLWKVLTHDLAFGWATTLRVGGGDMHRLVSILSAPWGGFGTPTPEQIDQSRIVLKEGLARVQADSTASWWPFLLLCVAVYGALPRLILSLAGFLRERSVRAHPPFHHPGATRLARQLTRDPLRFHTGADDADAAPRASTPSLAPLQPEGTLELRFSEPLLDPDALAAWTPLAAERLGCALATDPENATGALQVIEAWQPPLEESLRALRRLREDIGPSADLLVLLVGETLPDAPDAFAPPDPDDVDVWKQRLAELPDPRLGVVQWRTAP